MEYDLCVGFDPALNIEDVGVLSPAPNNNGELLEAGLTVSGELAPVTIHCRRWEERSLPKIQWRGN